MKIDTCNDHKDAAISFLGRECPLCAAIEYHDQAEERIAELEGEVGSLKDEIAELNEAD